MRMKSWLMTLLVLTSGSLLLEGVVMPVAVVQAQTVEEAQTWAFDSFGDQLYQQGIEHYENSHFEGASQSWQQALALSILRTPF
jgi:hypothetical protein